MNSPRFLIPFERGELECVDRAVVLNMTSDRDTDMLARTCVFEQDDAQNFTALQERGNTVEPRIQSGEFDRAFIFLSKHAQYNRAMIARAWQLVKDGGDILIEGAKTDGIDSLIRGLRAVGLMPISEPKSHGKIVWFDRKDANIGALSDWAGNDDPYVNEDGYTVRPGIFSSKNIDKGTKYFLEELNIPLKGMVADFGGGYGAISKAILANNSEIEALDLYEISHLACECAKANIDDERIGVHWLSVANAAKEYYNVILSNPPFHKGRTGDPNIGFEFIASAAKSLRARGAFYMVANKHLPYEYQLNSYFGHVEVLAQNNAYKIFKATRPQSKK